MKILVTGGAGFIGSNLADALIKDKNRVAVLDNLSAGKRENLRSEVAFYQGDLLDHKFVSKVIAEEQPEIIYHLAAQVSVEASFHNPVQDASANIIGTLNLLDQAVKNDVQKIVFTSSAAVYGTPIYLPIDENHRTEALSCYALSKYTAENYLSLYKKLYNLDYSVLRLANVYGPGQLAGSEAGVVAIFIQNLFDMKDLSIFGDGEQTRDFIYIEDVVEASIAALSRGSGRIVNISTKNPTSINTLYHTLKKIIKHKVSAKYLSSRPGDICQSILDNRLAAEVLNWQPKYALEEGLRRTVQNW